ncbi:TIGR02678 family protein [Virgibacillus sp. NKC19-16]|uniref:TIGR02678 family protein n=1 Tax=Virgibacillus salidurans TaxID=2831673 RepID=UPI001F1B090F|nr:TIGR02678 family protein [Virgibacillus sp. NKC19-16]UJL46720.1 TIGR02678 family protein [Virgibacillus sp. NKC19-16]
MIDVVEGNKKQISEEVQRCIRLLIERFWITRDDNEELYYLIKDNEAEIKAFFRDTFRYRLIITHDLVKLEKVPVKTYNWMGNKEVKSQTTFKKQRDFVFLFCILAFIEGKGRDDQFSLQNICEAIQAYYPQADDREHVTITWKEGSGYQNRLSLIRVLKYALKMKLIVEVDQHLEDFAADDEHDVLFERTPYVTYFIRNFKDLFAWKTYNDFKAHLDNENDEYIDGKHRFYRRLFLEPIVYHHEITEDEQDYVKRFYHKIESNVHKYTGYEYERYKHNSVLTKTTMASGEVVHPAENMLSNLILRFAGCILENQTDYEFSFTNEVDMSNNEIQQILTKLKMSDSRFWSKSFKQMTSENLRNVVTNYLVNWNFADVKDDKTLTLKEGLFRIVGNYSNEHTKDKEGNQT